MENTKKPWDTIRKPDFITSWKEDCLLFNQFSRDPAENPSWQFVSLSKVNFLLPLLWWRWSLFYRWFGKMSRNPEREIIIHKWHFSFLWIFLNRGDTLTFGSNERKGSSCISVLSPETAYTPTLLSTLQAVLFLMFISKMHFILFWHLTLISIQNPGYMKT